MMSQLVQGLQQGWNMPWFITYTFNTCYGIGIVPWAVLRFRRTGSLCISGAEWRDEVRPYAVPTRQLIYLGLLIQFLSACNGFTWYLSLPNTLLAANNSIYQSSSAFVFIISVFLIGEVVNKAKILAVLVCIVGVCLVSFAPTDNTDNSEIKQSVTGYAWCICSTLGYSILQVMYSKSTTKKLTSCCDLCRRVPSRPTQVTPIPIASPEGSSVIELTPLASNRSELPVDITNSNQTLISDSPRDGASEAAPLQLPIASASVSPLIDAEMSGFVAGWMGIGTMVTLWPLFFIFNATGFETFELPTGDKIRILAISAALDSMYQLSLLFGIVITSPLWISVGTVLVVPASLLADWMIHHVTVSLQAGIGIAFIVAGFLILQVPLPRCMTASQKRS
jgi:drug/metabolite transporter (DMT)-like permease